MDNYIRDIIFKDNKEIYNKLDILNKKIKNLKIKDKPYLIEFLGSSRSGKTTTIDLIVDVLRKNGLKVDKVDEESIRLTNNINKNRKEKMNINSLDYTNKIIEKKINLYDKYKKNNSDIVIFDRGVNDEFTWLYTFNADNQILEKYNRKLKNRNVNTLIILTCDIEISLKRKYLNSLSIMPNKWTNYETLKTYLNGIEKVYKYFLNHSVNIEKIDTSNKDKVIVALNICNMIINNIENK